MNNLIRFASMAVTRKILTRMKKDGTPLFRPPLIDDNGKYAMPHMVPKSRILERVPKKYMNADMSGFAVGQKPGVYIPRLREYKHAINGAQRQAGAPDYSPTDILVHEYAHSVRHGNLSQRYGRVIDRLERFPEGVKINPRKTPEDIDRQIDRMRKIRIKQALRNEDEADSYAEEFLKRHGERGDLDRYRTMAEAGRTQARALYSMSRQIIDLIRFERVENPIFRKGVKSGVHRIGEGKEKMIRIRSIVSPQWGIDNGKVSKMARKKNLPPPVVSHLGHGVYVLKDGNHRVNAILRQGKRKILAKVQKL